MKIRYCVSRVVRKHGKRRKTETRNGMVEVFGVRFGDDKVREEIRKENQGWLIVGYCRA